MTDPWALEPVSISLNNASSLCGSLNYSAIIGSERRVREGDTEPKCRQAGSRPETPAAGAICNFQLACGVKKIEGREGE